MPPPPFFPPTDPALLKWQRGPQTQFTNLTAATLGDTGTSKDGFDQAVGQVLAAVPGTLAQARAADQAAGAVGTAASGFNTNGVDALARAVDGDTKTLVNLNDVHQAAISKYAAPPKLPATPNDVNMPDMQIPGGLLGMQNSSNGPLSPSAIVGDLEKVLSGISAFAKGLMAIIDKALLAVPVWGWVLAGIGTVVALLWHGADPKQVPAAKTEQVFELAADGFHHLFMQHYIDLLTVGNLYASLIATGAQREQALQKQYGEARPFQNAITNMTHVIMDLYRVDKQQPVVTTKKLDLMTATTIWNAQNKRGWYPDSVQAAQQIYWQAVNSIIGGK